MKARTNRKNKIIIKKGTGRGRRPRSGAGGGRCGRSAAGSESGRHRNGAAGGNGAGTGLGEPGRGSRGWAGALGAGPVVPPGAARPQPAVPAGAAAGAEGQEPELRRSPVRWARWRRPMCGFQPAELLLRRLARDVGTFSGVTCAAGTRIPSPQPAAKAVLGEVLPQPCPTKPW